MVAFMSNDKDHIFGAVRDMYTDVATHPEKRFHFPTGRAACEFVGYSAAQLDAIPATACESFAGVGYPFAADVIRTGNTVLDIGSGSGTDALIAASLTGPNGQVLGLDMTDAMRQKLKINAQHQGTANVEVIPGNAEEIPLPDASVHVVTSNGVLNLVPDKHKAFAEIFRVLRPGGHLQIADIVVGKRLSDKCREDPQLWAECIVGAVQEGDYFAIFKQVGFTNIEKLSELDYFSGSSNEETRRVAASFGAHTVVMRASKPAH